MKKKQKNPNYFLKKVLTNAFGFGIISESQDIAGMAQSVEHVIGNDEVISSILITSSKNPTQSGWIFCFYLLCFKYWFIEEFKKR